MQVLVLPISGTFFLLCPLATLALLTTLAALGRGGVIIGLDWGPWLLLSTLLSKKAMVLYTYTPQFTLRMHKNIYIFFKT